LKQKKQEFCHNRLPSLHKKEKEGNALPVSFALGAIDCLLYIKKKKKAMHCLLYITEGNRFKASL